MADRPKKRTPTPTDSPTWARPVHLVLKSKCGGAHRGDRFTSDPNEVSCRLCAMTLAAEEQGGKKE